MVTRSDKAFVIAWVSGTLVSLVAVLCVAWPSLSAVDRAISQSLQALRSEWFDTILIVSTSMADTTVLMVTDILIILLLVWSGFRRPALLSAGLFLSCATAVQAIKWLIHRPRPINDLYDGLSDFSFPSGHATNLTATLLVLFWLCRLALKPKSQRTAAAVLIFIAITVGFSRVYLRAHWLSDVIAGHFLAIAIAALGVHLLDTQVPRCKPFVFWAAAAIWVGVGGIYTVWRFSSHLIFYSQ